MERDEERERKEMLLLPLQRRAVWRGGGAEGSILPYWVQRTLAAVG